MKKIFLYSVLFFLSINIASASFVGNAVDSVVGGVGGAVGSVIEGGVGSVSSVAGGFKGGIEGIIDGDISGFKDAVMDGVVDAVGSVVRGAVGAAGSVIDGTLGIFGIDTSLGKPSPTELLDKMGVPNAKGLVASAKSSEKAEAVPFGGRILVPISCGCTNNLLLVVSNFVPAGPSGLLLLYDKAFSQLYEYYNLYTPGNAILGTYSSGPKCEIRILVYCVEIPVHGAIDKAPGAGTSLIPGF